MQTLEIRITGLDAKQDILEIILITLLLLVLVTQGMY